MLDLILSILSETQALYQQAGVPVPKIHMDRAYWRLADVPPENLPRLPAYVRWKLETGGWSDPAHTKPLLNLLRDGDWDVEIVPRTLPNPRRGAFRIITEEERRKSQQQADETMRLRGEL